MVEKAGFEEDAMCLGGTGWAVGIIPGGHVSSSVDWTHVTGPIPLAQLVTSA